MTSTSPIPRRLRPLLAAALVSYTGFGLTLPFLLIYLHQVRHLSLGVAGLLTGAIGVVTLFVVPMSGAAADTCGIWSVTIGALSLQAFGTIALVFVHSAFSATFAIILFSLGQGATYPVWASLLGVLTGDDSARPRVFALNAQLQNLGIGIGTALGGVVVTTAEPASFVAIYWADGLSTLLVVAALAALRGTSFDTGGRRSAEPEGDGGYRAVLADRRLRRYLIGSLALSFGGYSSMEIGYVALATTSVHVSPRVVAWAITANTVLLVTCQPLALRLLRGYRRTTLLRLVSAAFALVWILMALGARAPGTGAGVAAVVGAQLVFAVGEMLSIPVSGPLVNDLAPARLRGRYNAAASSVVSVAGILSPMLAGLLLGAGRADWYIGLLVLCCVAGAVGFTALRRVLDPADEFPASVTEPTVAEVLT